LVSNRVKDANLETWPHVRAIAFVNVFDPSCLRLTWLTSCFFSAVMAAGVVKKNITLVQVFVSAFAF